MLLPQKNAREQYMNEVKLKYDMNGAKLTRYKRFVCHYNKKQAAHLTVGN
jgi:hypothetical protein